MKIVTSAICCAVLVTPVPPAHSAGMTHDQARAFCKEMVRKIGGDAGGSRKHGIYVGCVHDKMKSAQ